MRIEIVLGSTVVLALLLLVSQKSPAGYSCDTDGDGAGGCDFGDNCVLVPNGPLGGVCSAQEDGDMDGYGNSCDSDFNNNGATDPVDLSTMVAAVTAVSMALVTDLNCNTAADSVDLATTLADAIAVTPPGPSGYPCAGSIPCP